MERRDQWKRGMERDGEEGVEERDGEEGVEERDGEEGPAEEREKWREEKKIRYSSRSVASGPTIAAERRITLRHISRHAFPT